jgi:eukaryotic-like serine/threonine-protein kinase
MTGLYSGERDLFQAFLILRWCRSLSCYGAYRRVRTKSSPVLSEGTLFFGNDKGTINAVSSDGKIKWSFETGSPTEAPPLIYEKLLFAGSADGNMRAIDKSTGKLVWTYKTDNKIAGSANIWESGSKSGIVFGSYDYFLYCVQPESGRLLWKLETQNYVNGAPSVFGTSVVFGGCDGIIRIADCVSGRETDTINIGVYIASSPAISAGRAYFGDYDGELYCVDLKMRKVDWQVTATENAGPVIAIPAAGNNFVIIGNDDKYMYCFNINTGKQVWKFRTNGQITGSAVMTPTKVLFGSTDGNIYLLNLSDGKKIWSFNAGASIGSSPVVIKDKFYFLTEDGRLLAFGSKN